LKTKIIPENKPFSWTNSDFR